MRDALKRWPQSRVIQAWHGTLTLGQIAARSGYSRSYIGSIWSEAKAERKLPDGDRPHFPQNRRSRPAPASATPPQRDVINVRSVDPASGWPEIVTDILQQLARFQDEERVSVAETVLATLVCGHGVHGQERFMKADLAGLHVLTLVRRHASGEKPLPVLAPAYDQDRGSLGTFADPCIVHRGFSKGPGA